MHRYAIRPTTRAPAPVAGARSCLLPGLGLALLLVACGDGDAGSASEAPDRSGVTAGTGTGGDTATVDPKCGTYASGSQGFTACEMQNYARTQQAGAEQQAMAFQNRADAQGLTNTQALAARDAADPSWLDPRSGNTPETPLCATGGSSCVGDPFRYPESPGPDGKSFYDPEATVTPVVFYDRGCARLSGRVWLPKAGTAPFPAVVIQNGSVQAPEQVYWWAAQALVRDGFAVMTFDPRGQGRSDQQTPTGGQGSNANSAVFWEGLVDAIDFFRSSAAKPYPNNAACVAAGTYATKVTSFNPIVGAVDADRLGIAGHSLGGVGVSVVQAYGAPGALPWPGKIDATNPVKAVVAWDGLFTQASNSAGNAGGNTGSASGASNAPAVVPRVPVLGQNSEYGLTPTPFTAPPDKTKLTTNFREWQKAGVPAVEMTLRGATHYEWSLLPTFPATSWCLDPATPMRCRGTGDNRLAEHYTLAWFDRWLKKAGEPGFDSADARLTDDAGYGPDLSFYYQSARNYPARDGTPRVCADMRAGC